MPAVSMYSLPKYLSETLFKTSCFSCAQRIENNTLRSQTLTTLNQIAFGHFYRNDSIKDLTAKTLIFINTKTENLYYVIINTR